MWKNMDVDGPVKCGRQAGKFDVAPACVCAPLVSCLNSRPRFHRVLVAGVAEFEEEAAASAVIHAEMAHGFSPFLCCCCCCFYSDFSSSDSFTHSLINRLFTSQLELEPSSPPHSHSFKWLQLGNKSIFLNTPFLLSSIFEAVFRC